MISYLHISYIENINITNDIVLLSIGLSNNNNRIYPKIKSSYRPPLELYPLGYIMMGSKDPYKSSLHSSYKILPILLSIYGVSLYVIIVAERIILPD